MDLAVWISICSLSSAGDGVLMASSFRCRFKRGSAARPCSRDARPWSRDARGWPRDALLCLTGGERRAFPLKRRGVVVGVGVVVGRGAVHLHVEEPPLVACFQVSGLKEGRHRGQGLVRGHEGRGRGQEGGGRGHGVGGVAPGQSRR